ncbi:hypothetical protein ACP275_11G009800 [Erythranthe tilingii]
MEAKQNQEVVVIMVPFPLQSHLNQLLQLSSQISSYDIPVHYLSSAIHRRQATSRAATAAYTRIHFHDIPLPPFTCPPPNPNSPNKFPVHLQPALLASLELREPVAAYLRRMAGEFKRVVVVHDTMMAYVVEDVSSIPNAESYSYNAISALAMACFIRPLPEQLSSMGLPVLEDELPEEISYITSLQFKHLSCRDGDLYNTSRLIEAPYLDILENVQEDKIRKSWAIGPILPAQISSSETHQFHKCLEWLDKQEGKSVIYVAFGSTTTLSDEEVKELAFGLERSRVKFLWVLRDADRGDVFDGDVRRADLPEGFEERVEGVGMVVRDWAPQLQILAHRSVGGFMSHCGWNSCVESIAMGVPMAAWAMHSEQPVNSVLVTEVLKLGIAVREWRNRMELVKASVIEDVVRRLMASGEGDEMRRRAAEVGAELRRTTEAGGASRMELDSFVAHITR